MFLKCQRSKSNQPMTTITSNNVETEGPNKDIMLILVSLLISSYLFSIIRTPIEFYSGTTEHDAADTARNAVGVLDKNGQVKKAAPTGFRIMTPKIPDVGVIRLRYPIFPAHWEASTLGEEITVSLDFKLGT